MLLSNTKTIVLNAVIRSKLIYGLDTMSVNHTVKKKLDAFYLKGLRTILKIPTIKEETFRHFTNEYVYKTANEKTKFRKGK